MNFINFNENLFAKRAKERYLNQTEEIKRKIDDFRLKPKEDYQLQKIKASRKIPEKGTIFELKTHENEIFYGIVLDNNAKYSSEDVIVVAIFKECLIVDSLDSKVDLNSYNLLIPPQMVTKGYWTLGFFHNIGKVEFEESFEYGFYDALHDCFRDKKGNVIDYEPRHLGLYGMTTFTGVAAKITMELIYEGKL